MTFPELFNYRWWSQDLCLGLWLIYGVGQYEGWNDGLKQDKQTVSVKRIVFLVFRPYSLFCNYSAAVPQM